MSRFLNDVPGVFAATESRWRPLAPLGRDVGSEQDVPEWKSPCVVLILVLVCGGVMQAVKLRPDKYRCQATIGEPQIRMNKCPYLGQGKSDPGALHRRDLDEQRHGNQNGEDTQRFFQPMYAISCQRIQAFDAVMQAVSGPKRRNAMLKSMMPVIEKIKDRQRNEGKQDVPAPAMP